MSDPGPRIRALVLAAGLGRRLLPLTARVPKPLLPVAGVPVAAASLERLAAIGCEAAAIKLHYLGGQIAAAFGEEFRGLPLTYSREPELLGTLGALAPLRDFLAPADVVLLLNGDSFCRWPLERLLDRHLATGAAATLLLAARPDPAGFGGGVGIDRRRWVRTLFAGDRERGPVARRLVFAGAHALAPELLERVGPGFADSVRDLYAPLLDEGAELASVVTTRRWHDLGTPRRYLDGVLAELTSRWISPSARVATGAQVRRSAVESGAEIEAGAEIERSVVLPGARIGKGATVCDSIVAFDAVVAPGSRIAGQVVAAGNPPRVTPLA